MCRQLLLISGLLLVPFAVSAQNVTQPSSMVEVSSADDYATMSFQDPWDMSERTDLGWFTYSVDMPFGTGPGGSPGFNNISFSGGFFSADTATNDPALSVLDTGSAVTAQLGKIGTNYPIDADTYTVFSIRMKLDSNSAGQFFWSENTIYGGISGSGAFAVYSGWAIYRVSIPALGIAGPSAAGPWSGNIDSLRFDPTAALAGENIEIDWIRLVNDDASLNRTISWTGSGLVDIYLDNDNNHINGNLGTIARSYSGTSFPFNVGSLAPGDYYVHVVNAGGDPATGTGDYSSGFYRVNDIPTLQFTSPSEEGSSDEFATVQLNNAWDMDALTDIDRQVNHSSTSLTTVNPVQDEAGNDISPLNAFRGVSIASPAAGSGDPYVYPLWFADSATQAGRGRVYPIDSDKYRILVLNLGVPGNRDLVGGSIARIVWKRTVDSAENVSEDIVLRSMNPTLVMNKIIADMDTLPIDSGFSPVNTGWNGMIDNFRVDAHEFSDAREYYIKDVKLAAFEKASSSYVIRWSYSDSDSSSSDYLDLYYDNDRAGFNGVWIGQVSVPAGGQYTWNSPPNGTHYIYAVYDDGNGNTNRTYARWPIVVDSSYVEKPKIVLDKSRLNFNVRSNRSLITGSQKVRLSVDGAGLVNWSASSNRAWLQVSPTSGSGNDALTVSVNKATCPLGAWDGTITVSSSDASNAPRFVRVFGNVAGTSPPFGSFDVPANGTMGITGAIPISGWILDDIEVMSVQLFRDPVAGEGSANIYVGDAVFVEGARPDVEQLYPAHPFNYRAGWGYMMLTYGLPNQGNGTYVIHAYATDKEGRQILLGSKTITCDNANAAKPFGTIDTPGQGGTVSDIYSNWGWVLTPQPNDMIRSDGSSVIQVYIDGVLVGTVDYGYYRADIATAFPGYANSNNGVGVYDIDTTAYDNGVHNVGWYAVDDGGRADGIGSRFFIIENTGSPDVASTVVRSGGGAQESQPGVLSGSKDRISATDSHRNSLKRFFEKSVDFVSLVSRRLSFGIPPSAYRNNLGLLSNDEFEDAGGEHLPAYYPLPGQEKEYSSPKNEISEHSVKVRRGFKPDAELTTLNPGDDGFVRIEMKELDRIEIHLPGVTSKGEYEGYHVVGNDMRRLPIGSSLDGGAGIFYWALPPGFLGEYQLLFRAKTQVLARKETRVLVKVVPKFSANPKSPKPTAQEHDFFRQMPSER